MRIDFGRVEIQGVATERELSKEHDFACALESLKEYDDLKGHDFSRAAQDEFEARL